MLVRDSDPGINVFVQIRHASMPFAAGMLAFPGGRVDAVDESAELADRSDWARRLGTDEESARASVNAARRELLEETTVTLAPSDLHPWAHWVTPRFEVRRFDTWFFLAALPGGQNPRDVSGEASHAEWAAPGPLLARAAVSEVNMLPPTQWVLGELATYSSVQDCLTAAQARRIETIMPGWVDDGEAVRVVLPGDAGFPGDDPGDGT